MVTSFGSSAEPIGAGSTYFRVVRSVKRTKLVLRKEDRTIAIAGEEHTLLLVDLQVDETVDGEDDHVGQEVDSSDNVQGGRVVKRDLFRDLHHPKDDNQVGSAQSKLAFRAAKNNNFAADGIRTFVVRDRPS